MFSPSLWCLYLLCLFYNLVLPTSSSSLYYHDNNSSSDQWLCHEDEQSALLTLKRSFTFTQPYGVAPATRSWKNGTDCCGWEGIKCHPLTHHVVVLNLDDNSIIGTIHSNSTLFHLRHLRVIILSFNDFSSSSISPNFGNFHFLKHLDLSDSGFLGKVPFEIGQLSQLTYLDLSSNHGLKFPESKMIISNLTKLRTLNLSYVSLDSQSLQSIPNLCSLESIALRNCSLRGELPASIFNLPHLRALTLSYNYELTFPSTPSSSLNRSWSSPLEYLDLSSTDFPSYIPSFLSQFPHLKGLSLSNCRLRGSIPDWVWNISQTIDLWNNELTGTLPSEVNISKLFNFTTLDLGNNLLVGEVPSWLFSLESLAVIDLSYNHFSGSISLYDVISNFPKLSSVFLSNSGLSVTLNTNVPVDSTSFSTLANSLEYLVLSSTSIYGEFPKWFQQLVISSSIVILDISQNMLTGRLPNIASSEVLLFDASNNKFTGPIDSLFCNFTSLATRDLSNNNLSGNFPHCLRSFNNDLLVLNLGSNNIHGTLPTDFSMFRYLQCLNLSSNLLEGQIPQSLTQCTELQVIDFKGNNLVGEFPLSLHTLPNIQVLDLSYNSLHGPITNVSQEHPFSALHILDLSYNNFSGKIPTAYFQNFKAMMTISNNSLGPPQYLGSWTFYSITLTMKGVDQYYPMINEALYVIDLSNNAFEGEIPECIGQLVAIRSLNLSHNHLTGHIPPSTGKLSSLESLDLSSNMLTAHIPQELVSLTFLEIFNVSNNHLVGRIPTGNNFDTYSADSYKGNPELYGPPLLEGGSGGIPAADNTGGSQDGSEDDGGDLSMWKIVMMGFGTGVVIGLAWGYCMLTLGRPLWFVGLADKMAMVLLDYRDGAFGRPARTTTRN